MTKFSKFVPFAVIAVSLIVSSGASFAAAPAPKFSVAEPGNGIAMDTFQSQLEAFNKQDVLDLLGAKTVSVVKYDGAWIKNSDRTTATQLLTKDGQAINLLREALKANPAAAKLLAEHKIAIKDVIDIVSDGQGAVQIYVS